MLSHLQRPCWPGHQNLNPPYSLCETGRGWKAVLPFVGAPVPVLGMVLDRGGVGVGAGAVGVAYDLCLSPLNISH